MTCEICNGTGYLKGKKHEKEVEGMCGCVEGALRPCVCSPHLNEKALIAAYRKDMERKGYKTELLFHTRTSRYEVQIDPENWKIQAVQKKVVGFGG